MSFYNRKWWKEAIGYQIYIKSFKDSNNDGIGDINGIIQKLDYFVNLGINLLWICPFYQSPMDDNGYDVSDYYQVDPLFGTIEDFKNLIKEANKRKIKIIVELILNQTSDEHFWFQEAKSSKDNPYRDYYIWADGKKDGKKLIEPTNWASFFGGSAWEYDENTKQYYMKIFSKKMPDLNWSNKEVRKSMQEVAKFWLNLGASGFRVDAVSHLGRKEKLVDSKLNEKKKYQPDWRMFSNLPVTFDYLKEFKEEVFSQNDVVTIGEVGGGATVQEAISYAGIKSGSLNMVFNFDHCWANNVHQIKSLEEAVKVDLLSLKRTFDTWQTGLYGQAWNPIYWLNHDHPRLLSQYGNEKEPFLSGSMLATSLYFMWGTPFIYQGEELGMVNYPFQKIEDFNDVAIYNFYMEEAVKKTFNEQEFIFKEGLKTRDNARTIMSWDDSLYAGFSDVKPWFHLDINYVSRNVEIAQQNDKSLYNFYKKIIRLRKNESYLKTLVYGSYKQLFKNNKSVYSYVRQLDKTILVITNFYNKEEEVTIKDYKIKKILLSNYERQVKIDQTEILTNKIKLRPYEAIVYLVER